MTAVAEGVETFDAATNSWRVVRRDSAYDLCADGAALALGGTGVLSVVTDSSVVDPSHCVHFYERDSELLVTIGDRLVRAALQGEAVVCIATNDHTVAIRAAFADAGVDVEAAESAGGVVFLDASATLDKVLVDGVPDRGAFDRVVGDVIRTAGAGERSVHAFGEMVALLWSTGDIVAAIDLEHLWNDLGEQVPFSLLCGYPIGVDDDPRTAAAFLDVCSVHSEVVGAAPVPSGFDVVRRFARTTSAPRLARRFVTETVESWGCAELLADAQVVVSELVTNAVLHAGTDLTVALRHEGDVVRLAVGDSSVGPPVHSDTRDDQLGGRGLVLVVGMAADWGYDVLADGKVVWCVLDSGTSRGDRVA